MKFADFVCITLANLFSFFCVYFFWSLLVSKAIGLRHRQLLTLYIFIVQFFLLRLPNRFQLLHIPHYLLSAWVCIPCVFDRCTVVSNSTTRLKKKFLATSETFLGTYSLDWLFACVVNPSLKVSHRTLIKVDGFG